MTIANEILSGADDGMAVLQRAQHAVQNRDSRICQDWERGDTLVLLDDGSAVCVEGSAAHEITADEFRARCAHYAAEVSP